MNEIKLKSKKDLQAELVKQYKRERARARRAITKATKEGYEVKIQLPKVPKKITQGSINRLKNQFSTAKINEKSVKNGSTRKADIVRKRWNKKETTKKIEPKQEKAKPVEIETTPVELVMNEYDVLVELIENRLYQMPDMPIEMYSKAASAIVRNAFNDFKSKTIQTKSEEACASMRSILEDELFNKTYFDSEQVNDARSLASDIRSFAEYIKNEELKQVSDEVASQDEYIIYDGSFDELF